MVYTSTFSFSRMSFLFFWIVLLAFPCYVMAQSPGGVASNLKLWLKANSSVTPAIQGAAVTAWNDLSGGSNHATIPALTPVVLNPTYQQNTFNFNPSIRFSGTSNLSFSALSGILTPAVTSNNVSVYSVFLMNSSTSAPGRVVMISQNLLTSDWQNMAGANFINRNGTSINGYRNGIGGPSVGPVIGMPVIASTHFTAANQWKTEINGNVFTSAAFTTTAFNAGYFRLGQSTYSNDDYFNGDIAEVILYSADQSSLASHNQIESYLAVKYGIHKTGSYVNSSGTNIWDATVNVAYHNDVFGIGQDNASGLLQTQSNSTNTGDGSGTGQSGKGNITISNPSSLTNNAFLMIGHNTGALTEADIIDAGNPTKRIARIWKVQRTGNLGTVTLNYDRAGLTYSGTVASDYTLLVDPTGAGNFSGASVITYKAAALNGTKVTFNNIDLPNGAAFTFQTLFNPVTPTVQATEVNFNNTTTTGTDINWTNGNGGLRAVFIRQASSGNPAPVNNTTYTANTVFGSGTQIGATGWYCIYNGIGTTVNVTGLTAATTYQVMVVEYNGSISGNEIYHSLISTNNPVDITTITNLAAAGPGGVLGGVIWYKANAGITLNASNVSQWTDSSGNSNTAIQGTAGNQPAYTANSINFNQAVSFSGNNFLTAPVTNLPSGSNPRSIFIVATSTNTQTGNSWMYGYGNGGPGGAFNVGKLLSSSTLYVSGYSRDAQSTANFWIANTPKLGTVTFSTPTVSFFDAGAPIGTAVQAAWNTVLNANSGRIGSFVNSGERWIGNIAEVVMYPSLVTGTAAISVESYLGIKYGIHKTGNYLNSAGVVVWDATLNIAYHNDIFGIAQDDLSELLQVQSNSSNTGSGDGTGQTGKGNIIISNPSSLINNGFLMIGHDASALTETDIIFAGVHSKRVQRIWKTQTTGNPGNVTLSYDITGLSYSGQSASDYVLLVDPTGLGVFDGGSVVKYTAALLTGNKATFNAVALPNGAVFTFQTLATPTVQATNVVFSGTTATTTTASWTNGSGSSRAVFMFAGTTGSALPIDLTAYTPNTVFGSGTQIGTTGWYCVYNGTGTTVNITGLTPLTTYQLMTVEYTGLIASQLYLSTISTGNPAGVTTLNNVATLNNLTISQGTLDPTFATATTIYTANVANAVSSLTVTPTATDTNAMITVNGEIVISGNPSEAIPLAVGPNIITTVVTAQDGITLKTYTITINRTAPATIVTTGTVLALNTVYGTPSASGTFNISGTDMLAGILVTAPSGFEVSTDNTTFTNTVTVGATGIIASTPVYIRLKGNIPAGNYLGDVALSSAGATTVNFAIVSSTVNKAALTITAADKTKTYGVANPALTVNYSGFVNGDTATNLTTAASSTTTATIASGVGTYPITPGGAVSPNYTFTYVNGNLDVTAASLTFTADDKIRAYGAANPVFTGTYDGFVNGDTESSITTPAIFNTVADATSVVGDYPIIPGGAVSPNYVINYVFGNLAVTKATLTITADAQTKIYGQANPTLTISYAGFANGESVLDLTTPPTIATTAALASPVGTYPIVASGAAATNYTFNYVDASLTVTTATLTVTAVNKTKVYGDANPVLTVTYSGFANGETVASLLTPPTIATTAALGSPVGTYPIVASGGADPNYTFSYIDGTLTVTVATLTITAVDKTKAYGAANPTLTVTYSGFVNGETELDLLTLPTATTTAVISSPVGSYPIVVLNGLDPNYTFNYIDGTLSVTPVTLTITAENKTKIYGDTNPTLTVSYAGFVNGDSAINLTTAPTITTTAATASAVGSYPIVASAATDPNYVINFVDGTLTVTQATLTITADDKNKVYGDVNPALTISYAGFVNGETVASLLTPPTISTTATTASSVGTYPITVTGASDPNYIIDYVNGTLTVSPTTLLTIVANNQSKTYGDANPALTVSYVGFVNGDTEADLTTLPTITTTAIQSSPAGTYPITASGAVNANYTIAYTNGILTVNPAVLTVTADAKNKVYGDANPALTVTYSGFVNGESATSLTTVPTITTTADATSPVGGYPITASGAVNPNYTFNYVPGNLEVTAATLTITAENKSKAYADVDPTLTVSYSGFVNGDSATSFTTAPTITTTATTASPVGTYPITASGAVNSNYTINYINGTLSITPVALTITADNKNKVYGDANPTLTVSYTGFVNGDTVSSLTTAPIIVTTADATSAVGTYPITASGAVNNNYTITYNNGTLTVNPAALTITADAQTKGYGAANPSLTASYTGFVNGDTFANLSTPPTITTTATAVSPVGTYPITATGAVNNNYVITYAAGTLTVTPAVLTVTADAKTKVYGDVNPAFTATYSGFVNSQTESDLLTLATFATTATAVSPVGTYSIVASGAADPNYTFNYVDGNLTITAATLTVTADTKTKIYGDTNPILTATYSGFVNGETESNLLTLATITTTAVTTSPVGTYPIIASAAVDPNYTFNYVAGTLTVTPVTLTITADNQTKAYGDANPALTVSYSGFVNGDSATSLTTAPSIVTTASVTSPVGTYPITASGAVDANYTFNYVAGTLTISPVILNVTADNQTKGYGDANPTLTVSYSGFVNGDSATSLTTAPTIVTTADVTSPVGTYPITASGAVDANYTFNYVAGILTISPVVLTVTADNQTKGYGDANPTLTVSYSGFVNGDSATSLTTAPTIVTTADATSQVGTYPITASGAVDANYTFNYVAGTLTISPVVLTVTADNQTKDYGDANPALTVSYSGFVNGDSATSLTTVPTIVTTADATSPVGTYPITASGAVDANYTFNYVAGILTISPVVLTVTADNQTKLYGDANPTLTVSYSGFVNGDSATSLTTAPMIVTTADVTSPVGTYPITASGAVDANYTFSYVAGTLTVNPVTLTVTADNQTRDYGEANPTLTATYSGFVNGDSTTSLTTLANVTTTADITSPVGTYPITAIGAAAINYIFNYVDGILTVMPLTDATLSNLSVSEGTLIPVFAPGTTSYTVDVANAITSITVTPVTNDADATVTVNGVSVISGNASGSIALLVGTNIITVEVTAQDGITIETYTITVNRTAPPTISTTGTLAPLTTIYGTASASTTFNVSGTDMLAGVLVTAPSGFEVSTDGTTFTNTVTVGAAGVITSTPVYIRLNGTIAAGSYSGDVVLTSTSATTVNIPTATSTVSQATLTITANDASRAYGAADPAFTTTPTGFVNGDTSSIITTQATATSNATATSPVGNSYIITPSGAVLSSSNYTIAYVNGNLEITTATLTITADDKTKIYGDANPPFTFTYTGFVNGDTVNSLITPPVGATTADATSPVGIYPITISGATSSNYTIGYTAGATLSITPANLAIKADDKTKIYGEANPTFTFTYTGFVNGDIEADLTTLPVGTTTADVTSPVGIYPITISGATSSNYTIGYTAGATLSITPANLAIKADDKTKIYGEANPPFTFTYTGFVNGDTVNSLTTPPVGATTADVTSPVGIYPITISGATSSNYTIGYTAGSTLSITPANLAIKADDKTKIYGDANPAFTFSYLGFVNGDTVNSLTTPPVGYTTADATSPVGIYPITVSGATSSNYTIGYTAGSTLSITPLNLAIAANDQTKIYGEANPVLTLSYTGFVNGDTQADLLTPAVASTTADATSPVGVYPITISGATSNNYTIGYTAGATLTVTPATLTVTANNQTRDFGEANPILTAGYTGFVNGDTVASITTLATVTTTANTTSPPGTYPITAIGALATNYIFSYVVGILTVMPLTDATLSNLTISEGTLTPVFASGTTSYTAEVSNAIASVTITPVTNDADATITVNGVPVISGNASGAIPLALGSNTITVLVTAQDGTTTETYTITVNRTALPTIVTTGTFAALSTTYGTASTSNTFNVSGTDMLSGILVTAPSGFEVSTDGITFTNTLTVGAAGTIASTPVYIRLNGTIPAGNYSGDVVLTSTSATTVNLPIVTSTVNPAVLTITAVDATRLYGAADPAFSTSVTGFVNGDTNAIITTVAIVTSNATITSPTGNYALTPNGSVLSSSNYTIVYVNGNLTITTAILTITADAQTKIYGAANPTLTASYGGFVNGDTAASLTTAPTITTVATTASSVGNYIITVSGAVSSNYTFNYVDGNLAVTPAPLIITADNQTKVYGSPNPIFTSTYAGFVNGDTASSLTVQPVINTPAVTASPVGTYLITDSGAVNPNYTISYVSGNLTVTAAPLTITADNKTRAYGAANPPLTASYAGFVNGETVASLTTPPTISTIANVTSPVGVYAITVSGAVDSNYAITYVTGVLTVTSPSDVNLASLTISNGVLTPAFSPNILSYNVNVSSTINTETITVVADDPLAKITINGNPIVSGSSFTVLSLLRGVNTFTIKVTSEDGLTTKSYVLTITKEGADDASLSNLTISKGILEPKFKSDITNYDAVVRYDVNSITVTPTATDPGATITVNGIAVASNTASTPITLLPGENIIETVVTGEDGITKEIYAIIVYKGLSPDALVITNILSPNGDGKNDFWVIKDIELFPNNKVTVYDRAGRIVYSKNSYSNEWDGSYGGSPLNNDTYYYLIDLGEDLPKIKGFITMIRD
ncbi:cadherin-like beta sandwich domain-containing protein [Flavobacterium bizetiae]|uniref:MBG domain-containing protein n=1 Tax=Flavobacterium bizetiae TaxID=2704140 RepID=UPI0021E7E615|nr:MBG domain-containing protein [Flavobacterium bizetiae]UTN03278.1 cadherin-like beta sandwich domain-containing protein [Flavobacterium bizetiae]